jgi:hypothetical protein
MNALNHTTQNAIGGGQGHPAPSRTAIGTRAPHLAGDGGITTGV